MAVNPRFDDQAEPGPRPLASRLIDGHGSAECASDACRQWAQDAELKRAWHEYHLIGDVLRSQELGSAPARDARFLDRLRERLADEPPIVAPALQGLADARSDAKARTPRWVVPTAAAAGFVAVAAVLVVMRGTAPEQTGTVLAGGAESQTGPRVVQVQNAPVPPTAAEATLIRDARIDEYLQAHRQMRVSPVAAMPGGGVRNVDVIVGPAR